VSTHDEAQTSDRSTSRRRVLTGIMAGAASVVAVDVIRPAPAGAADGDTLVLGQENQADNTTRITMGTANAAIHAVTNADDGSLVGENTAPDGYGLRGTGAYIGVNAVGNEIGTYTVCDNGVALEALTYDGTAVRASVAVPTLGYALETAGRVRFSSAGRTTVAAGQARLVLTGLALSPASIVLATLQTRRKGVYIEAVIPNPAANTAVVHLNKATPVPLDVGWFVIG
jgi:hypothetical protein